jgi:hypothetical protein
MDPVTGIGLAAAVIQLIGNVKTVINALRDVKDASEHSLQLREEFSIMPVVLGDLSDLIANNSHFSASAPLKQAIKDFDALLKDLNNQLEIPKSKGLRRLKWVYSKDEREGLIKRIGRYRSAFKLALNIQTT